MTLSAHWDDMGPTLDSAPPRYGASMTGPGRWCVLVDGENLIGTLWTNDRDALGLVSYDGSSRDHVDAVRAEIQDAKAKGTPAKSLFDQLVQGYRPKVYGQGNLSELADSL